METYKVIETEFFWLITSPPHITIKIEKNGRLWCDIKEMNAQEWAKLSDLVMRIIHKEE